MTKTVAAARATHPGCPVAHETTRRDRPGVLAKNSVNVMRGPVTRKARARPGAQRRRRPLTSIGTPAATRAMLAGVGMTCPMKS